ncbi:MAG: MBL fold metallo-hydrolase [Clostridiales Family XIII bacterium]|jgi:glyoxylase-like metal-dependent hydrolase (beta-lactamase superfamily II)|nr:MBL fold metallo-hydrolase [Clostridiales Family XIII bacterium]
MSRIKAYILEHGYGQFIPRYLMFGGEKVINDFVTYPSYTVLVEHPDGLLLYDASTNLDAYMANWEWANTGVWIEEPGKGLFVQLRKLGYEPPDLKYVVVSHLHPDHNGIVHLCENAEILVPETDFTYRAKSYLLRCDRFPHEVEFWAHCNTINWRLLTDYKTELLDGVTIYNYGEGHAGGILTMLLELEGDGNKLVVSDAVFSQANLESAAQGVYPGYTQRPEGYFEAVKDIKRIADEKNAEIWFGHDNDQFAAMRKSPEKHYE